MLNTNEILSRARTIIDAQPDVPRCAYVKDIGGLRCFCAVAAVGVAAGVDPVAIHFSDVLDYAGVETIEALARAMDAEKADQATALPSARNEAFYKVVVDFNDIHGREPVLKALDRAIEATS